MTTKVLWNRETQEIRSYPRTDAGPVIGLQDPPWRVLEIVQLPEPEIENPDLQELVSVRTIDEEGDQWVWGWDVRDRTIVPPEPNYQGFYDGLITSNVYFQVVNTPGKSGDQSAAMTIFVSAILNAMINRENRTAIQAAIWFLMEKLQNLVTPEGVAELQMLLSQNHMAAIYSLLPPPPPQFAGQTWTDANGQVWVVVQARAEDGQFLPDDPATPQRESLTWEAAI
jgi:hypothetical protein